VREKLLQMVKLWLFNIQREVLTVVQIGLWFKKLNIQFQKILSLAEATAKNSQWRKEEFNKFHIHPKISTVIQTIHLLWLN
jgi:hypothetical protein